MASIFRKCKFFCPAFLALKLKPLKLKPFLSGNLAALRKLSKNGGH